MKKNEVKIPTDNLISKTAGFGVPTLIFLIAKGATGLRGAAAITTALAALGPGGMVGGVVFLLASGFIIEAISKWGFDATFAAVIKELYKKGETKETILAKINKYHVSKDLKQKLIGKVSDTDREN